MRTFIAFELPAGIKRHMGLLQERLKRTGLKLRWVAVGNIHLTMRFLGEIDAGMVDPAAEAVANTVRCADAPRAPIDLVVQGLGVFPNIRRPNVLWTGLGGRVDVLQQLYGLLDERLALLGFPTQRRPFRPHLTLARVKDRIDTGKLSAALQEIGNFDPVPFRVAELILFRSDLRPRGAVYTKLAGQLLDPGA